MSARFAASAPKECSATIVPIAPANWCAGRSGRATGCCATRHRRAGSSSLKDVPGRDFARVPAGLGTALYRNGRAARRQRAGGCGRRRDPSRSRPAGNLGARGGARSRSPRSGERADRLYRCARHRAVAAGDRRPLPDAIRRRRRSRRGRRHDRLVGRLSARLSRRLRAWRPSGARCPGVPGLSQHPDCARHRAGADRSRGERPLPAHTRATRRFGRSRRVDHRQPGQPDRNDDRRRRPHPAGRLLPRSRHPPDLGRDLPRHHL